MPGHRRWFGRFVRREPTHEGIDMSIRRRATPLLGLVLAMGMAGCDGLLDVDNPNSLVQEDLESPAAAGALANGALATMTRGWGYMMLLHGAASDELQFTGSRNAWIQLQEGDLRDAANEFTVEAFPFINEGRWMADEAVRQLSAFDEAGQLGNRSLLARSHLYSGMIYTQIADLWEDWVISDRRQEAPPVGPNNMTQMYDTAIQSLTRGLEIAASEGNAALAQQIRAQRARSYHARAVRQLITPAGTTPSNPLVNDAQAVADAQAVLAQVEPGWRFRLEFSSATVTNQWGGWVNERLELRPSDAYVSPTDDDKRVAAVTLQDPIDGVVDPFLEETILEAAGARNFDPVTVVSARELRLILAEAALATDDTEGFATHINAIRGQDGLTPWDGQVDALELLQHTRMANLYKTGRRLNDHYRFGTQSFLWAAGVGAAARPGTLLPIAQIERTANCHILGTC